MAHLGHGPRDTVRIVSVRITLRESRKIIRSCKGKIQGQVAKEEVEEDTLMEIALEAGAEDIREDNGIFEVITAPGDFETVKDALDNGSVKYIGAEVTMLPQSTTALQGKDAEQMIRLMEALDDCEDVQKVYTNADIPEELIDNL